MTAAPPTPQQVLDLPMRENHLGATTIRDYLTDLLATLWIQGSDFNSKRPFGYSDWQFTIYKHLVRAGWVEGVFDDEGGLDRCDTGAADVLIDSAIRALSAVDADA